MGKPTKNNYKIDIYELIGDGIDGFWTIEKTPVSGEVFRMEWAGANSTVTSVREFESETDFYKATKELKSLSSLPAVDQGINVNDGTNSDPQQADQFEAPFLTDAQVLDIATDFPPVEFSEKLGALRVVKRFLQLGSITWQETKDIFIYLGLNNKALDTDIQPELDYLTANAVITPADEAGFWVDWTNAGL